MQLHYEDERPFTVEEAFVVTEALMGTGLLPHDHCLLWSDVEEAIEFDGLDTKWGVDGAADVARIKGLDGLGSRVVLERLNTAQMLCKVDPMMDRETALRMAGLIR